LPLYHDRPETGGFFASAEFIYWRQTNTIGNQIIAVRGFQDTDGSIQQAINTVNATAATPAGQPVTVITVPGSVIPGKKFGSQAVALSTNELTGQNNYMPGIAFSLGWRFADGITVEFSWHHLQYNKLSAEASFVPQGGSVGLDQADSFLFSPVFNFPPEFSGPLNKIGVTSNTALTSSGAAATITPTPITGTFFGTGGFTLFSGTATASSTGAVLVPGAAPGIWNGATTMTEEFAQKFDSYDLIGRIPIYQDDCFRCYGLVGPRFAWFWEKFSWRTVALEAALPGGTASASVTLPNVTFTPFSTVTTGGIVTTTFLPIITGGTATATAGAAQTPAAALTDATDVALYSNIVSNRMYGPLIGGGSELYLGQGFSLSLDVRTSLLVDIVKERAKYELGDHSISIKRARTDYTLVPELDAIVNLWWYPIEGVEVRFGYDIMTFFNTVASPSPVAFDYGTMDPGWQKGTFRLIDGLQAGISFIF
jgi:hypothetical protein